jgi:hypothetical protein
MPTIIGTDEYEQIVNKYIEQINFQCNFIDGRCANYRKGNSRSKCCCGGCYPAKGYLYNSFVYPDGGEFWKENYSKLFKRDIGFYRPETGCALPRKFRSTTCNFYICDYLLDKQYGVYTGSESRKEFYRIQDEKDNTLRELYSKLKEKQND